MNALKHIIMMEDLIANPSNDASLFPLQRNLLSSKGLSFVPLSSLVSFSFCSQEEGWQKAHYASCQSSSSQFTPHDEAP